MSNRSTFPQAIDTFTEHRELTPQEVSLANRWKTLRAKEDKNATEIAEFNSLTEQLSDAIFSSEDINKIQDCMVALETFFKNDVDTYLDNYMENFNYKGEWERIVSYKQFNTVTLNGSSYIALTDNLDREPGTIAGEGYWGLLAAKGDKTIVETYNNTVTLGTSATEIDIGIEEFDGNNDTLYVFKDGILLVKGEDYNLIAGDSQNSITPSSGSFPSGIYHFEVITSIPSDFQTQLDNKGTIFRVWE